MLQNVLQVVANYVYLLFGGEQVVYSGFIEQFHWKQLPTDAENDAMRAVRVK